MCNKVYNQPIALITEGSRPASIAYGGGIIYILAHDEWYAKMVSDYRANIMAFHFDTRSNRTRYNRYDTNGLGGNSRVGVLIKQYRAFVNQQRMWYGIYGLRPPTITSDRRGRVASSATEGIKLLRRKDGREVNYEYRRALRSGSALEEPTEVEFSKTGPLYKRRFNAKRIAQQRAEQRG